MTTPHGERPLESDVPGEEGIDPADAAERLEEDPDDIQRNQEQAPDVPADRHTE